MLLSARLLNNVFNVNAFDVALETSFTEGDQLTIYLQLTDLLKDPEAKPFSGRRYVPANGATLQVVIKSVDTAKTLTKIATNPFPGDTSIWSFPVLPTDGLKGSWSIQLVLTESGIVTRGRVEDALLVLPQSGAFM